MFRTSAAAVDPPTPPDVDLPAELVALSVLALDLDVPPEGWAAFLAARGVQLVLDDLGRASVARADARRLFTERREQDEKARVHAAAVEQAAIEADQRFRAQLGVGVPAGAVPDGVAPAAAMLQAAHDARPRRVTPLQEALSQSGTLTFHPIHDTGEE